MTNPSKTKRPVKRGRKVDLADKPGATDTEMVTGGLVRVLSAEESASRLAGATGSLDLSAGLLAEPDEGVKVNGLWLWPLRPDQKRRDRTYIGGRL